MGGDGAPRGALASSTAMCVRSLVQLERVRVHVRALQERHRDQLELRGVCAALLAVHERGGMRSMAVRL